MSARDGLVADRVSDAIAAAALVGLKLAAMLLVVALGFSHVSDDDYSRTVIAQNFAHAPKLDPSGTSWLPLPFWISGTAMLVVGRSLSAARAIAWTLGALGALAPYFALRHLQFARVPSFVAAAVCALMPWSVWLAATTVPEGWTGPLVAAALLLAASDRTSGALAAGALLFASSLSRYETWPSCAVVAIAFAWRMRTSDSRDRSRLLVAMTLAAIGPLLWMAWNAYAHEGDPLHFFARVAAFRQHSDVGPRSIGDRVLEFPLALMAQFPLALVGLAVLVFMRRPRARGFIPIVAAAAIVAFLIVGDLKDGAPTHHPERALGGVATTLVALGVATLHRALTARTKLLATLSLAVAIVAQAAYSVRDTPGTSDGERRDAQIARGRSLTTDPSMLLVVTPCQYEHFALIAATGAPERFTIESPTRSPVTDECPRLRAP